MKKSYFLSIIMAVSAVISVDAMESRRPEVYQMIDETIQGAFDVDWGLVFSILDSMPGVIDVNQYRYSYDGKTLLYKAVYRKNFAAAKTLLEKYHANPNIANINKRGELSPDSNPLLLAIELNDYRMVNLLLTHGADPNKKNSNGQNCLEQLEDDLQYRERSNNSLIRANIPQIKEIIKVLKPYMKK
jgi:hypothetical protein